MAEITAYPLAWPDGWPRTAAQQRDRGDRFKSYETQYGGGGSWKSSRPVSFDRARRQLAVELGRLGASDIILSTNLKLRIDGEPYAGEARRTMDDPGVAVYFKYRDKPMVMAVDRFQSIAANMRSLGLAIEAMRQLERHGGGAMMERAFTGFAALPPPMTTGRHWRDVLGLTTPTGELTAADINLCYRNKAKEYHPDKDTGSLALMAELNVARDQALTAIGAG